MKAYKVLHPGKILKNFLNSRKLTINEAATKLGVKRGAISRIINCHGGISPEMSVRLATLFKTTINFWMNLQFNYDYWLISKKAKEISKTVHSLSKEKAA